MSNKYTYAYLGDTPVIITRRFMYGGVEHVVVENLSGPVYQGTHRASALNDRPKSEREAFKWVT